METLDVLKGARELLSDPEKWSQEGFYAVTSDGCGLGAVVAFNDDPETTHADVLAALDCAIAKAEAA